MMTVVWGDDIVSSVPSPDRIAGFLRGRKPDRYVLEEISMAGGQLPFGCTPGGEASPC